MPGKSRPLPFRRKKNGKEYGPYYVRIKGQDITLRTKDPEKALERAKEAHNKGKRDFEADGGRAAANVVAALAGTGGASSPPVVEPAAPAAPGLPAGGTTPPTAPFPPTHTAPPALPPVPPAAGPESPAGTSSVRPDAYIPPPPNWADQVAAAAGTPSSAEGQGAAPGAAPELDDKMFDEILGVVADVAVEGQLMLQAWLIRRRAKLECSPVPPGALVREKGRELWLIAIKEMFPGVPDLPPWLLAPLAIAALSLPTQLHGAKPVKEDVPAGPDVEPEAAAAAA